MTTDSAEIICRNCGNRQGMAREDYIPTDKTVSKTKCNKCGKKRMEYLCEIRPFKLNYWKSPSGVEE